MPFVFLGFLSFWLGLFFFPFLLLAVMLWVFGFVALLGELGGEFDTRCGCNPLDAHAAEQMTRFATKRPRPTTGWKRAQLKRRGQTLL